MPIPSTRWKIRQEYRHCSFQDGKSATFWGIFDMHKLCKNIAGLLVSTMKYVKEGVSAVRRLRTTSLVKSGVGLDRGKSDGN
jgi:hypothetical protein